MISFDPVTGYPPPGRLRLAFDEAYSALVLAPRFAASRTRAQNWTRLEQYLARFAMLETSYAQELGGRPLLHYLWLGGSYVSTKLDPRNIDVTVCVDAEARDSLRGKPGSGWLNAAFQRDRILAEYAISPLEMQYTAIESVFRRSQLTVPELDYLRDRGSWDDWWQRCRDPEGIDRRPSKATAGPRRGYLEVTL